MQDLATLLAGGYRAAGLTKLKLSEPLPDGVFPREILDLGATLELLDLSGTGLSALPDDFGTRLPHLRIAFFSGCRFARFPAAALAGCAQLEMVAFRSNGMETLGEPFVSSDGASTPLAGTLRWLILTDNRLAAVPASIGRCVRLEKCMLAGNRLAELPGAMAGCRSLTLLRLAANRLAALPPWLLTMPRLAFLSFAGNPCTEGPGLLAGSSTEASTGLPHIDWHQIEVHHVLGQGASGVISKGVVKGEGLSGESTPVSGTTTPGRAADAVAIKIFRGALTSDGTPYDEMAANIAAGHHVNLVRVHGQIRFAEEEDEKEEEDAEQDGEAAFQGGIVMELIPPHYRVLGQPPSFASCTRDCFAPEGQLTVAAALGVLQGVASAAAHLHARGIAHGDLYAHNILVGALENDTEDKTHALLSDFGASTLYGGGGDDDMALLEKIEVLAFAHLVEDVLGLLGRGGQADDQAETSEKAVHQLAELHGQCAVTSVAERPTFAAVVAALEDIRA